MSPHAQPLLRRPVMPAAKSVVNMKLVSWPWFHTPPLSENCSMLQPSTMNSAMRMASAALR